jgi:hypothetical protein
MTGPWHNPERQSTSFEAITVADTAIGLTLANLQGAVAAEITLENGPIRFRTDGTAASATVGHLLSAGSVLYIDNPSELAALSMIRDGATSGNVSVSYFNQ